MRSLPVWGVFGLVVACGESVSHAPGHPSGTGGGAGHGGTESRAAGGMSGSSATSGSSGNESGAGRAPAGSGGMLPTAGAGSGDEAAGTGLGGGGGRVAGGAGGGASSGAGAGGAGRGGTSGAGAAGMGGEQPVLIELRVDGYDEGSRAYALSEDGTYVAGEAQHLTDVRGVRWKDAVPTVLEENDEWDGVHGRAISGDGAVVGGYVTAGSSYTAFLWDGASVGLLSGFGGPSKVTGLNGDGRVAVGLVYDADSMEVGARWAAGSLRTLPPPRDFTNAIPVATSFDGIETMGTGARMGVYMGARWVADDVENVVAVTIEQDDIQVSDVSGDGKWFVGTHVKDDGVHNRAFRSGMASLDIEELPAPSDGDWRCEAVATNVNASVVVGNCTSFEDGSTVHPFLWSERDGTVLFDSLLDELGIARNTYDAWEIVDFAAYGSILLLNCRKDGIDVGVRLKLAGVFN